jgi:hypothetical protein
MAAEKKMKQTSVLAERNANVKTPYNLRIQL